MARWTRSQSTQGRRGRSGVRPAGLLGRALALLLGPSGSVLEPLGLVGLGQRVLALLERVGLRFERINAPRLGLLGDLVLLLCRALLRDLLALHLGLSG